MSPEVRRRRLHLSLDRDHTATTQNVAHLMVDNASALYDRLGEHGNRIDVGDDL